VPFDPGDGHGAPLPRKAGDQPENLDGMALAGAGSGVTCAGDGAGGVTVDNQGGLVGGIEPSQRVLNGCNLGLEGRLLGPEGPPALSKGSAQSFRVRC
jgi:hypothetical protein